MMGTGFTQYDNLMLDHMIFSPLPGRDRSLFDLVVAETVRFKRKEISLSLRYISAKTGLRKPHVCNAIKNLSSDGRNMIVITENGNGKDKLYRINTDISSWKSLPKTVTITENGNKHYQKRKRCKDLKDSFNNIPKDINTISRGGEKAAPPRPLISFDWATEHFTDISGEQIGRWREAYPAVDVDGEIKKAAAWMAANPAKKKKNYKRFLANWLLRIQERGGNPTDKHLSKIGHDDDLEKLKKRGAPSGVS